MTSALVPALVGVAVGWGAVKVLFDHFKYTGFIPDRKMRSTF